MVDKQKIVKAFARDHKGRAGMMHLIIMHRTAPSKWQHVQGYSHEGFNYVIRHGHARRAARKNEFINKWYLDYASVGGGPIRWPTANGMCQRCGRFVLTLGKRALRLYYEPSFRDKDQSGYAPLYLCPECLTEQDITPRDFWRVRRAHTKNTVIGVMPVIPDPFPPARWTIYAPGFDIRTVRAKLEDWGAYLLKVEEREPCYAK